MPSIKGDISVMPLADLLQWVGLCNKTGTVHINKSGMEKKIYVEAGKVLFVSSNKEGERFGEFLQKKALLELSKIKSALLQSQTMKVPFTQRLIDLKYFSDEELKDIIIDYAKDILASTITWTDGNFEFTQDDLPVNVLNSPIRLNMADLIYDLFRIIDDINPGFRNKKV
jgi:hypothetical protein